MVPETVLRYVITICCILVIDGLFYWHFDIGKHALACGIVTWGSYFGWIIIKKYVGKVKEKEVDSDMKR